MSVEDFNASFEAHLQRVRSAFSKAFARSAVTQVVWSCSAGMHEPLFLDDVWICNSCSKPLDERARFA